MSKRIITVIVAVLILGFLTLFTYLNFRDFTMIIPVAGTTEAVNGWDAYCGFMVLMGISVYAYTIWTGKIDPSQPFRAILKWYNSRNTQSSSMRITSRNENKRELI